MVRLRAAATADLADILPRTRKLNDHEGIAVSDADLERALRRLLGDPSLGGVWLVERDDVLVGYAIVTYGYDLEFAGRDAWLTELWIDDTARGSGTGAEALRLLGEEVKSRGVNALHLQVRQENPALRLYQRAGFNAVPRLILTKRL